MIKMKHTKKKAKKIKTKLVCIPCACDPESYQNDVEIPRGENITTAGYHKPYCYDCGDDRGVDRVPLNWKPEIEND